MPRVAQEISLTLRQRLAKSLRKAHQLIFTAWSLDRSRYAPRLGSTRRC